MAQWEIEGLKCEKVNRHLARVIENEANRN
jgi:hypothetical protein